MSRKPQRTTKRIFKKNERSHWFCRVKPLAGKSEVRSTGTHNPQEAESIVKMLDTLREQKQYDLIDMAAVGRITLSELYKAHVNLQLGTLRETIDDVDLSPYVDEWGTESKNAGCGAESADLRVTRVRTLIAEDAPFPRSALTEQSAIKWTGDLRAEGLEKTTVRQYAVALKMFSAWARKRNAFARSATDKGMDPLVDWVLPAGGPPRNIYFNWEQCQRVLGLLPNGESGSIEEQCRVAIVLMMATGMELSTVLGARGRDVNQTQRTVWAHGRKTASHGPWRDRNCQVRKWAWADVSRYARPILHNAPLFPDITEYLVRSSFYAAQYAAGYCTGEQGGQGRLYNGWTYENTHRIHDLRHTFCYLVMAPGAKPGVAEDGDKLQGLHYCKKQLGHGSLKMVQDIYANFNLPDALSDDEQVETAPAMAVVR